MRLAVRFCQSNRVREPSWQCRIQRLTGLWIDYTTGEADFDKAKAIAEEKYRDIKYRQETGKVDVSKRFSDVCKVARRELLDEYEKTGRAQLKDKVRVIDKYQIPMLGKYNAHNITTKTLLDFDERREQILGRKPSKSTIKTHNSALAYVLNLAQAHNYILAVPVLLNSGAATEKRPVVDDRPRFEGAWERKQITEITRNVIDYRGRTPKKLGMEWGGGDIPALSARNVKMGHIDFSEETHFASEKLYQRWMQTGETCPGDLVVTLEAPLGNIALIPDGQKYILSQRVICLQIRDEWCYSKFVFHVLAGEYFQSLLLSNASGSTAQGIQRSRLERLHIPRPLLPEQRAIAAALSDVDDLLQSLERLITKKREIKQGAMQQLLTGTTRLPGFEGAWETKQIGSFTICKAGGTPSTEIPSYWGGPVRWMSSGELNLRRVKEVRGRLTEEGLGNSSAVLLPANCVLIGLAGQGRTRGTAALNLVPLSTNQSIAAILPSREFSPEYLYFNLHSRYEELRELSSGGGGRGGMGECRCVSR